jgi:hypothetical protein
MRIRYSVVLTAVLVLACVPYLTRADVFLTAGAPYSGAGPFTAELSFDCATPASDGEVYVTIRPWQDLPAFNWLRLVFVETTSSGYYPGAPLAEPIPSFWDFSGTGCNPNGLVVDTTLHPTSPCSPPCGDLGPKPTSRGASSSTSRGSRGWCSR